jgi:hypothetical protein
MLLKVTLELILYINVSWILLGDYLTRLHQFIGIEQPEWFSPGNFVEQIAQGSADDPYRGRILVPWILVQVDQADNFMFNLVRLDQIQSVYYLFAFVLVLFMCRVMLTTLGFDRAVGLAGALFVAALLPLALRDHGYQAWSWLEAATFPLVVIMTLKKMPLLLFAFLGFFAALNRETAIILPLIPLAVAWSNRQSDSPSQGGARYLLMAVTLACSTVLTRLLLMFVWPGQAEIRVNTTDEIREWNLLSESLLLTAQRIVPFLGGLVVLTVIGLVLRGYPKNSLIIAVFTVPPLVAIWIYFALWWEVRVLLPVVILLLPLALSSIFTPRADHLKNRVKPN